MKLKLSHHLLLLAQRDSLQMLSLVPVDPTREVEVVTVSTAELARVFAFTKKAEAARRNSTNGARPRSRRVGDVKSDA